ncbi:hypothetical protein DCMF_19515 [Candidatus Formimonas warabiya]|uniref:Uncharacterized protein n=1 Tax=Formimonas warabiya TaxID=1761012 RepID=A0A3G1KW52_FORW1|nr:hypothetical protein DCMF_19515 [Candidatus Formimonas warabiya]
MICSAFAWPDKRISEIKLTRVPVFPVPGPLTMSSCPQGLLTIFSCCRFKCACIWRMADQLLFCRSCRFP